MLSTVVLILAGITAWCVASLALALIVGPMVRKSDRAGLGQAPAGTAKGGTAKGVAPRLSAFERQPVTGAVVLPVGH